MKIEHIARICHEANRAYCMTVSGHVGKPWDEETQEIRDNTILGVQHVVFNPSMTPRQSHEGWCENRRANGWVYGPVKNEETKEHPYLMPYDQLPKLERVKDLLFRAIAFELFYDNASNTPTTPEAAESEHLN